MTAAASDDGEDNKVFVAVRVRPLNASERKASVSAWNVVSTNAIASQDDASTTYAFDRVFDETIDNRAVYEVTTSKIVQNVIGGFNGTVFAYGQTSSGKTHTMHGTKEELGVIPLAVRDVFDAVRRHGSDREFLIRVSYLEIYNEKMMDLFDGSEGAGEDEVASKLSIREDKERGTYVMGLREEVVTTPSQVLALLELGTTRRHVGATNMNAHSSRSHTIFRMIVESRAIGGAGQSGADNDAAVLVSTLNLVDLAGSERMSKTGAEGQRAKEGAHINKSLMTLGVVINKLSEGVESKGGHIPYRDSKLTRILQPALGGNSKTAIVCAMTPAASHCEETHSTLKFAQRAKRVVNKATKNEVAANGATNAMLKRQQKEIAALKARLEEEGCAKVDDKAIEALRRRLAEADREKNLMALALEDGEEKAKEREMKISELEAKVRDLNDALNEVKAGEEDPHTCEVRLNSKRPSPGRQESLSAMTPDTLHAMREFEAKIVALEKDRDELKSKASGLERSEKRREELERLHLDAVRDIAALKEEIAEITAAMVDSDGTNGVADVQILLNQAKRARTRAEDELSSIKAEFFEEKSKRAVAEAEAKRLGEKLESLLESQKDDEHTAHGDDIDSKALAHLALRKQVVKQNETISLLEARVKEADQMLDEAIKVYEEEVEKNKLLIEAGITKQSEDNSTNQNGDVDANVTLEALEAERRANDDLTKRCATLEKKYSLAKAAFAKLSSEKTRDNDNVSEQLKRENKDLKRQMHKLTEVYARLREKFAAGSDAFDKVKDVTELKYDLQALERKRQLEKRALLAKIKEFENVAALKDQVPEQGAAKKVKRDSNAPLSDGANRLRVE